MLKSSNLAISSVRLNSDEQNSNKLLQFFLLGQFRVIRGQEAISSQFWRNRKASSLLKILLARHNFQISRQEAVDLLWPELELDRSANNLNQALYNLRRILEPGLQRASDSAYIKVEGSMIQLSPALVKRIDVEEFRRLYLQAQLDQDLNLYEQAALLYHGDYLPENMYEDWSVATREMLRQNWLELLIQMAELYYLNHQEDKYQQCLRRVLENDFSHESTVQKLMLNLVKNGRREEALALYTSFASKLQTRLHLSPLTETQQLYQTIASGNLSDLPGFPKTPAVVAPKIKTPSPTPVVLITPVPKIPAHSDLALVGRATEVAKWEQYLAGSQKGLWLVRGSAGIGKSFLLKALGKLAQEADFKVLYLFGKSSHSELPNLHLAELLRQSLNFLDKANLGEVLKLCNQDVRQLLTSSLDLMANLDLIKTTELPGLFGSTVQVLGWLSRKYKLALVIDDLALLTTPTLHLLQYMLTQPNPPIAVATMHQNEPSAANSPLQQVLSSSIEKLYQMQPLNNAELNQLVLQYFKYPADYRLLERLYQLCEGNPTLAIELMRDWVEHTLVTCDEAAVWHLSQIWVEPVPLPPAIKNFFKALLAGLSSEAQILLKLVALVGPTFTFEILYQIVAKHADGAGWWIELTPQQLGQTLDEVMEAGLVEEQLNGYRFAFPLLVPTLVSLLSHTQRRCWSEVVTCVQIKPID
jgi:DNA-binding SARP family transcriptional activator